jgi:hypothetical protein
VRTVARLLIVAAVLTGTGYVLGWHLWGLLYAFGVHPYPESSSTPWTYQLWSGLIPALTIVSLLGAVFTHYRLVNCTVHFCPRVGRFPIAGGAYKVCRHHHGDVTGHRGALTVDVLKAAHALHRERQRGAP